MIGLACAIVLGLAPPCWSPAQVDAVMPSIMVQGAWCSHHPSPLCDTPMPRVRKRIR